MAQQNAQTLLEQYNKTGALSIDQMLAKAPETPVIAGETLTKTETPLVVEKPKEGTASSNLNQTISTAGTYIDPNAQKMRDESNSELKDILTQLTQQPGDEIKIQEKEGVFKKQQALTDIENRIASVNREYEKQARVIRKNQEGKFGGAVEQDLRNLQRQSDEQNADLSIIKSATNNDLQTALKISEAKINAKYEPLKLQLEALKTFREFNQDNLTESEKARLNQVISQENAKFEAGVAKETSDQNLKTNLLSAAAQQGAPSSVLLAIQQAKTAEEAITAAGQYGGDMIGRQMQLEQLRQLKLKGAEGNVAAQEEINKQATAVSKLTEKTSLIDQIITSAGLDSRVGVGSGDTTLSRTALGVKDFFTGDGQDFAGKVKQLTSQETLDTLLALKQGGGTLGAVNEKEFSTLEGAATSINSWEVKDPETGLGIGQWNIDEESFKEELKRIKQAANNIIKSYIGYDPSKLTPEQTAALNALGSASSDAPAESFY